MPTLIKILTFFVLFSHWIMLQATELLTGAASQPLPQLPDKMQAWQIHSYGGIEQLRLENTTIPHISESEQLLVKVKATALNQIDLLMLGGYGKTLYSVLRWFQSEFPLILGREFAGTVVNKGHRVDEFKIGDDVYGIVPLHKQGCQAEYVLADKSQVLLQPAELTTIETASILFTSITAWSALYLAGGLALGNPSKTKVLVLGASGGVGTVATQILKSQNATVVGVSATDALPLVTSLGADYVYDYKDPGYKSKVASHGTYDIILDSANFGLEKIPKDWKYITFVSLNAPLANNTDRFGLIGGLALSATNFISTALPKLGSGQSVQWGFFLPHSSAFQLIDKLARTKQLKPVIHKVFKFKQLPEAYKMLAAGHLRGKIVVDLQESN